MSNANGGATAAPLFHPATLVDPWATYDRLRDTAPVYFAPELGLYVVTRYDLVIEALRNPKVFSSRFGAFMDRTNKRWLDAAPPETRQRYAEITQRMAPPCDTMLTADEPVHTKYRSLVDRLFTAGNVRKMEPHVSRIIGAAIDRLAETDAADFMAAFATPVPLQIIADRLGIPEEDRGFFNDGAAVMAARLRLTTPDNAETLRRAKLTADMQDYLVALIEKRRAQPLDDMCSILAATRIEEEGNRYLNAGELWSILSQFLVAGHETTASAFGWGMLNLCREPTLAEAIRVDPQRLRTLVEETLRLDAPVQGLPRIVASDIVLGGVALKAGDLVMLRYGAANRDERQFACPAHLDLARKNAGSQLTFGSGIHHCVGAPLARQELNIGFAALIERLTEFSLDPDFPEPRAEPSLLLRSLPHLHIRFAPRR
jgi:cytochrome P450